MHSPLYLLNFIRLYIDERVNFILESSKIKSRDDEFDCQYTNYMIALGELYYSLDGTKTDANKEICVNFMNMVDAKLQEFCLDDTQFSIPNQISDFITTAFTDMHRLDLTLSQVACGTLMVKGKRQPLAGQITLTYPDMVASCLQLSKHAGQTLDWLVSFLTPRVIELPRDAHLKATNSDNLSNAASAAMGIKILRRSQTQMTKLTNELSQPQPNFTLISQISDELQSDYNDLVQLFRCLPDSITQSKANIAKNKNDEKKLLIAKSYLTLSEFFMSAHILVTTHYCGLHDNLQEVITAWKIKERKELGWTDRNSSKISKPLIISVKPVKEVITAEACTTLRAQCSIIESQLKTIIKKLPSRSDSLKYYDKVYLGLHHSWLAVQQLSSLIQATASNGLDNPDSQLSIASGLIALCQKILEQMGVARMGLYNYEPRITHGLCPFFPNRVRSQLNDERLIPELNGASNWVRYPNAQLHKVLNRSTLHEPEISPVFKALLTSVNKTQSRNTRVFQAEAVKIVQRTVSFTEGLVRIIGELVGIAEDDLKSASGETRIYT